MIGYNNIFELFNSLDNKKVNIPNFSRIDLNSELEKNIEKAISNLNSKSKYALRFEKEGHFDSIYPICNKLSSEYELFKFLNSSSRLLLNIDSNFLENNIFNYNLNEIISDSENNSPKKYDLLINNFLNNELISNFWEDYTNFNLNEKICYLLNFFSKNFKNNNNVILQEYLPIDYNSNLDGSGIIFTHSIYDFKESISGVYYPKKDYSSTDIFRKGFPLNDNLLDPLIKNSLDLLCSEIANHCNFPQRIKYLFSLNKLYLISTRDMDVKGSTKRKFLNLMYNKNRLSEKDIIKNDDLKDITFNVNSDLEKYFKGCGKPVSPGFNSGIICFSRDEAKKQIDKGEKVILVLDETRPEDNYILSKCQGIIANNLRQHTEIICKNYGIPGIGSNYSINVDTIKKRLFINKLFLKEKNHVAIDGNTGKIYSGFNGEIKEEMDLLFKNIVNISDKYKKLKVYANADTPEDIGCSIKYGAEGIGLIRSEHMFFRENRLPIMQETLILNNPHSIKKLQQFQEEDYSKIINIIEDLPVTIRLLDPPLNEFLPNSDNEIKKLARNLSLNYYFVKDIISNYQESNPMLGMRGARLLISDKKINDLQLDAIFKVYKESRRKFPINIMIPMVSLLEEYILINNMVLEKSKEYGLIRNKDYNLGVMIETPRSCFITADLMKLNCDFLSFGTNDLTQMTFGLSRDDSKKIIDTYQENFNFENPFNNLDYIGVSNLMDLAIKNARSVNPIVKIGICGEQGKNIDSLMKIQDLGLDYISCSYKSIPKLKVALAKCNL